MKWTMIGQMAIAVSCPGLNNLWCSVTPTFFFDGSFSLLIFYLEWKKNGENLLSDSVLFSSSFICVAVSNASSRVNFVKILATFGNINVTDSLDIRYYYS